MTPCAILGRRDPHFLMAPFPATVTHTLNIERQFWMARSTSSVPVSACISTRIKIGFSCLASFRSAAVAPLHANPLSSVKTSIRTVGIRRRDGPTRPAQVSPSGAVVVAPHLHPQFDPWVSMRANPPSGCETRGTPSPSSARRTAPCGSRARAAGDRARPRRARSRRRAGRPRR